MPAKLRQEAELYRRLASVPTSGGHRADRVLLVMADDLDCQAAKLEAQAMQQEGRPKLNVVGAC